MVGSHEPIAVDDRVRVVTAERLALGFAGDGDGLEELEVRQNPLARIGVDDHAITARGGEDDALLEVTVGANRRVLVNDRRQVGPDDDQVYAGVRPWPGAGCG